MDHTDEINGGYMHNQFWGNMGDATIGGLHAAIGSWCPVAEMYLDAGEGVLVRREKHCAALPPEVF